MPGIFLLHGIFPGYVDEQGYNRHRCVWLLSQCFKQYRHRLLAARFDLGVLRLAHHSVNRRMDSNPTIAGKIVHHHPDLTSLNLERRKASAERDRELSHCASAQLLLRRCGAWHNSSTVIGTSARQHPRFRAFSSPVP
jgi:hypothetical protein